MSITNTDVRAPTIESSPADRTRRVDPGVVHLGDHDLDGSLVPGDGSITLLWAREDSSLFDRLDRAVETGDADLVAAVRDDLDAVVRDAETATGATDAETTLDLTFHGVDAAADVAVDGRAGGIRSAFNGGSFDASAFEVAERGADTGRYEYRLVVDPPSLDDAERDAVDAVPDDAEGLVARSAQECQAVEIFVICVIRPEDVETSDLESLDVETPRSGGTSASAADLVERRENLSA